MNSIRKYWAVAYTTAKSNLAYFGEVGSRLFFLAVVLYIFMQLWKATYRNASATTLGGFSLQEMLWYLALTEAILLSGPRLTVAVDEDVRTGAITVQLVRPLSYPLYRLASYAGERAVRFATTFFAGSVIATLLVGPLPHLLPGTAMLLVALPLAITLDFLGNFLIGLGAFWLEDTTGLMLIYSRLTMILGGMLVPLEMFPDAVQNVLRALPFPYVVYGPARLFVHPDGWQLLQLVAHQALWIAVFGAVVWFVYDRAMQRVSLNGG